MIAVLGASGRSGAALCRTLSAAGRAYRPVVRDAARWHATGLPGTPAIADLSRNPAALRAALAGADTVVATTHARFAAAVLAAAPPDARLILMGSTRKFSRWPDAHGDGVRAGEAAFLASGHAGVMLHPTMIYGATGEDNVQRLARLMRRLPVLPLPDGGAALVQPIHQDDVVACLMAALDRAWSGPQALVIAGPEGVPYRSFVAAVAAAAGLRPPRIVPVPVLPLRLLAPMTALLPLLPRIRAAEIRRLTEDKAFDIRPMQAALGVRPRPLPAGLAETFARSGTSGL